MRACPRAPDRRSSSAAAPRGASASPPERSPAVERRYRLSRSKDFDAVYRQGRSVSTRYLTLHWFPREDDPTASRGSAWRSRRRSGTPSSATGSSASCARPGRSSPTTVPAGPRLRPRGAPGPRRAGRHARPRVARRAGERGAREGGGVRYVGIGLVQALAPHVRPADACRARASTTRAARSTRSTPSACTASFAGRPARRLAAAPLQPVEPRRCRPRRGRTLFGRAPRDGAARRDRRSSPSIRCGRSSTSSATSSTGCTRRSASPGPGRSSRSTVIVRILLVPVTVRADPLDAEPPGARAGDEGDPAEVEARQAAAERRADEVLPENKINPAASCLPIVAPDPDLHLALLRAAALRASASSRSTAARASTGSISSTSRSR